MHQDLPIAATRSDEVPATTLPFRSIIANAFCALTIEEVNAVSAASVLAVIDACALTIDEVNAVSAASVLAVIDACADTIDDVSGFSCICIICN